jgi:hypothetical protein
MISFTKVETREIDEKKIFNHVADFLFDEEIELSNADLELFCDLPEEVKRLIFAKVGAMLIDYAGSEEF